MSLRKLCITGALGVLSVGSMTVRAQSPPNQSQQGQASQAVTDARNNLHGGIQQMPWFSNPTIRKQLQLNEDQFNRLNNSHRQAWQQYNQGITSLDKNLTDEQRMQRHQQLNGGFYKDFSKGIDEVLAEQAARQRYYQMDWQYRGYSAFNDPTLQQQLKLNDEQLQNFNRYNDEWNSQMSVWKREFGTDRDGVAIRLRDARKELQRRINSTLSLEQNRLWGDLTGNPLDFPAEVFFQSDLESNSGLKPDVKR